MLPETCSPTASLVEFDGMFAVAPAADVPPVFVFALVAEDD